MQVWPGCGSRESFIAVGLQKGTHDLGRIGILGHAEHRHAKLIAFRNRRVLPGDDQGRPDRAGHGRCFSGTADPDHEHLGCAGNGVGQSLGQRLLRRDTEQMVHCHRGSGVKGADRKVWPPGTCAISIKGAAYCGLTSKTARPAAWLPGGTRRLGRDGESSKARISSADDTRTH